MSLEALERLNKGLIHIQDKLQQLPELADRVLSLEQRSTMAGGVPFDRPQGKSIGAQAFEQLEKNSDLFAKTRNIRLELNLVTKAATDPVTTGSGRMLMVGGVGAPEGQVLGIFDGLPQRPGAGITALEYSRFTGVQGSAAQQASEGAAKSAVRPDHSIITQTALTIAGFTKMSRQALNDRRELQAAIDIVLMREVYKALDVALVNGATGFTGGFEGLATAYTSLVYTALVDAISEGVATMQIAGFNPNVVFLNPNDWLAITVAKGSDGHYLSGSYLGTINMASRGLRVVLSANIDAGKALLMDTAHVDLLIVDVFAVELAYDSDDFTKNLITALGELRVIPVFRSVGAARFITPKP